MSLADLASLGSFISGIAVLISLLFVGFQMRQNTLAIRAAASQAHAANFQQVLTPIIDNAEVAQIWKTGLQDIRALTEEQRVRFIVLVSGNFRFFETAHIQWRRGQLDKAHWEDLEPFIRQFAQQPGIRTYWQVRGHMHSSEFIRWYETIGDAVVPHGLYDLPAEEGIQA